MKCHCRGAQAVDKCFSKDDPWQNPPLSRPLGVFDPPECAQTGGFWPYGGNFNGLRACLGHVSRAQIQSRTSQSASIGPLIAAHRRRKLRRSSPVPCSRSSIISCAPVRPMIPPPSPPPSRARRRARRDTFYELFFSGLFGYPEGCEARSRRVARRGGAAQARTAHDLEWGWGSPAGRRRRRRRRLKPVRSAYADVNGINLYYEESMARVSHWC